jgi:sugar/nucleoside kinase (ribokinase family)
MKPGSAWIALLANTFHSLIRTKFTRAGLGDNMGIVVVGSVALDSVKTPSGIRDEVLGGAATYFSVAASYFTDVSVVAVVGEDFPEEHMAFLQNKGIDTAGLERKPGKTFRWKGEYSLNLNDCKTLDTQLNVFADFSPRLLNSQCATEYLFLGNIDPTLQRSVLEQVNRPRLIACDTMNYWIENTRDALLKTISMIDLLVINDSEAKQLSGEANIIQAARKVIGMGPKILVVKRGEYGALLFNAKSVFSVPALLMEEVLDPTGAGDSFAGGMMGYLAASGSSDDAALRKAVVFGSVMASFNVMDFGPKRLGSLTFTEIAARYREFYRLAHFDDIEHD